MSPFLFVGGGMLRRLSAYLRKKNKDLKILNETAQTFSKTALNSLGLIASATLLIHAWLWPRITKLVEGIQNSGVTKVHEEQDFKTFRVKGVKDSEKNGSGS